MTSETNSASIKITKKPTFLSPVGRLLKPRRQDLWTRRGGWMSAVAFVTYLLYEDFL